MTPREELLADFRGLPLLLQHRTLSRRLDAIESAISACQSSEMPDSETASRLLPLLRGFVQALPAHFAAESKSNASLLRDCSDAHFARTLEQLEGEHPRLLASFQVAVDRFNGCLASTDHGSHVSIERATIELLTAIGEFRGHEAREDALFAD